MWRRWKAFYAANRDPITIISGLGLVGCFTPSLHFPDWLRAKWFELRDAASGEPVPVNERVVALAKRTIVGIDDFDKKERVHMEWFVTRGADPVCLGSVRLRSGAHLGLPFYLSAAAPRLGAKAFDLLSPDQWLFCLARSERNGAIDWSAPAARALLEWSAALTDDACLFMVSRQVAASRFRPVLTHMSMVCLFYCGGVTVARMTTLLAQRHPRLPRLPLYALGWSVFASIGLWLDDFLSRRHWLAVDREACRSSPAGVLMAEAGVRYYEWLRHRNELLRELVPQGSTFYAASGEWLPWSRYNRPSIEQCITSLNEEIALMVEEGSKQDTASQ